MVAGNPRSFDDDGRELDDDSGRNKCWYYGEGIKIYIPIITPNIVVLPAPQNYDTQSDPYHYAVYMCGWMQSDNPGDADRHDAFEGDFVVRVQMFEENGNPASDADNYYFGLPAGFLGAQNHGNRLFPEGLGGTLADMDSIPQGLLQVASQELGL